MNTEPVDQETTTLMSVPQVMNLIPVTRKQGMIGKFLSTKSRWRIPTVILVLGMSLMVISMIAGLTTCIIAVLTGSASAMSFSVFFLVTTMISFPIVFVGIFWLLIAAFIMILKDEL